MNIKNLISLSKLLERYEEGTATDEDRQLIAKMIQWVTDEATRTGSKANRYLIMLQGVVLYEDYLKVEFKPCYCFTRLFWNSEANRVEYQPASHYPEEKKAMKEVLLKSHIKQ